MSSDATWHVYLLRCRDGALYAGITTDVFRRLKEHSRATGKGARSLRGKGPLELVLARSVGSRGLAQRVEARIKALPKALKEELIMEAGEIEALIDAAQEARR